MRIPDLTFCEDCRDAASDPYVRQLAVLRTPPKGREAGAPLPPDVASARWTNAASNLVKERILERVVSHLEQHGIRDVAPLKGLYMLLTLYAGCPWLRPMADVDLLVRRSDYRRARAVMAELGPVGPIHPDRPLRSAIFHEFPCVVDHVLVEIHRGQTPLDLYRMDYDEVLDASERRRVADGPSMLLMPVEYATVLQIFHDLSNGLAGPMPLSWTRITQIHLMLHNAGLPRVRALCDHFGIGHFLDLSLHILRRTFQNADLEDSRARDHAWFGGIRRGTATPFEYAHGEVAYRFQLFRGALVKKTAPSLVMFPFDFALRLLRRGS